jgi:hypothetical protein
LYIVFDFRNIFDLNSVQSLATMPSINACDLCSRDDLPVLMTACIHLFCTNCVQKQTSGNPNDPLDLLNRWNKQKVTCPVSTCLFPHQGPVAYVPSTLNADTVESLAWCQEHTMLSQSIQWPDLKGCCKLCLVEEKLASTTLTVRKQDTKLVTINYHDYVMMVRDDQKTEAIGHQLNALPQMKEGLKLLEASATNLLEDVRQSNQLQPVKLQQLQTRMAKQFATVFDVLYGLQRFTTIMERERNLYTQPNQLASVAGFVCLFFLKALTSNAVTISPSNMLAVLTLPINKLKQLTLPSQLIPSKVPIVVKCDPHLYNLKGLLIKKDPYLASYNLITNRHQLHLSQFMYNGNTTTGVVQQVVAASPDERSTVWTIRVWNMPEQYWNNLDGSSCDMRDHLLPDIRFRTRKAAKVDAANNAMVSGGFLYDGAVDVSIDAFSQYNAPMQLFSLKTSDQFAHDEIRNLNYYIRQYGLPFGLHVTDNHIIVGLARLFDNQAKAIIVVVARDALYGDCLVFPIEQQLDRPCNSIQEDFSMSMCSDSESVIYRVGPSYYVCNLFDAQIMTNLLYRSQDHPSKPSDVIVASPSEPNEYYLICYYGKRMRRATWQTTSSGVAHSTVRGVFLLPATHQGLVLQPSCFKPIMAIESEKTDEIVISLQEVNGVWHSLTLPPQST